MLLRKGLYLDLIPGVIRKKIQLEMIRTYCDLLTRINYLRKMMVFVGMSKYPNQVETLTSYLRIHGVHDDESYILTIFYR